MAESLQARGSDLIVLKGKPSEVFPTIWKVRPYFHQYPCMPCWQDKGVCCAIDVTHIIAAADVAMCLQTWGVTHLYFEKDTEPYANERDAQVRKAASEAGIEVETPVSHTLYVRPLCPSPS